MKTVRINTKGGVRLIDIDEPQICSPNDVKVKIAYASICGYDMMVLRGKASLAGHGEVGHEASGIIFDLGSEAKKFFKIGDRVTINPILTCNHCSSCLTGQGMYCENAEMSAACMMSEYIVTHYLQIYQLHDETSLKEGCLTEPLTMALYTVRKAQLNPGKKLLILGGGSMGQIILRLSLIYPIDSVVVVDPNEEKLTLALKAGASAVIDSKHGNVLVEALKLTSGKGFDAVIEASGSQQSAELAFSLVARGGSLVFFGLYGMEYNLPVNLFNLYWKDASIHGVSVPNNLFFQALDVLPRLHLESVITGIYPFARAAEAFSDKATGWHAKVMLDFTGPSKEG